MERDVGLKRRTVSEHRRRTKDCECCCEQKAILQHGLFLFRFHAGIATSQYRRLVVDGAVRPHDCRASAALVKIGLRFMPDRRRQRGPQYRTPEGSKNTTVASYTQTLASCATKFSAKNALSGWPRTAYEPWCQARLRSFQWT